MTAPKLRFKEFDGDWFQSKIGEIFQVTSGSTPLRSDNRFFENADIAWVKTTDLNNGLIEKTEEKISQIALKETSVKILPKGTVFVAMYGGFNQIGRTGLLVHEAACNQALSAIYPNEKIDSYFLLTFLNHKVDDWKNFAASSRKDPNITKSDVLAFPLKYPVKEEQTKIAFFLSAVDEKISQLTQKHALLSKYKQGMMQKLFSQQIRFKADDGSEFGEWGEERLGACITEFKKRVDSNTKLEIYTSSRNGLRPQKDYFDNRELENNGEYGVVPAGFFTYRHMSDDATFKFNINNLSQEIAISKEYPVFTTNENLDSKFLYYLLNESKEFKKFALEQKKGGTRTRLYLKVLRDWELCLPTISEQTKIANFLSAIDQKIEVVAQQIEQAKQWKKGLLQQMFV